MTKCANTLCKLPDREIPDGQQVCVWDTSSGSLTFFFLCPSCASDMEAERDDVREIFPDFDFREEDLGEPEIENWENEGGKTS